MNRKMPIFLLFLCAACVCLGYVVAGCTPDDAVNPPVATACGLIGRDCHVLTGANPTDLVLVDLNGDRTLDLAITNGGLQSVTLSLNDGTGVFTAAPAIVPGGTSSAIAAGDFDNNGTIDLTVSGTIPVVGLGVSIFLNNGDATFSAPAAVSISMSASALVTSDLDGDGDLDLACVGWLNDSVVILLNNGHGVFTKGTPVNVGTGARDIDAGDLDGDGKIDLVVADCENSVTRVLINQGGATFAAPVTYTAGHKPCGIVLADLDHDGDLDIATADTGDVGNTAPGSVSVLLNDGHGIFSEAHAFTVGTNPRDLVAADYNGDGVLDLATADQVGSGDLKVSVLLGYGDGSFAPAAHYRTGTGPVAIAAGDLDGNGTIDLATANNTSNDVTLLGNDGNGVFSAGIE